MLSRQPLLGLVVARADLRQEPLVDPLNQRCRAGAAAARDGIVRNPTIRNHDVAGFVFKGFLFVHDIVSQLISARSPLGRAGTTRIMCGLGRSGSTVLSQPGQPHTRTELLSTCKGFCSL